MVGPIPLGMRDRVRQLEKNGLRLYEIADILGLRRALVAEHLGRKPKPDRENERA